MILKPVRYRSLLICSEVWLMSAAFLTVTTKDGYLEITMSKERTHNLDYQGGMLQSWNKLCFTGGYIEVSVSLPGSPQIAGFWPGAHLQLVSRGRDLLTLDPVLPGVWTMGNLARAGYGATTEGVWPL